MPRPLKEEKDGGCGAMATIGDRLAAIVFSGSGGGGHFEFSKTEESPCDSMQPPCPVFRYNPLILRRLNAALTPTIFQPIRAGWSGYGHRKNGVSVTPFWLCSLTFEPPIALSIRPTAGEGY
jgi:hypothetical protein